MYRKNIGLMIMMMLHGMKALLVKIRMKKDGTPGLICQGSQSEDQIVSDEETAVALNAVEECDFEDFPDATAEAIQLQCAAYVVMGKAGRGKGSPGGKGKKGFPVVRSNLSVEDRKRRLQEIKSRSKRSSRRHAPWRGPCLLHRATSRLEFRGSATPSQATWFGGVP